jgi:hypothetical protein
MAAGYVRLSTWAASGAEIALGAVLKLVGAKLRNG